MDGLPRGYWGSRRRESDPRGQRPAWLHRRGKSVNVLTSTYASHLGGCPSASVPLPLLLVSRIAKLADRRLHSATSDSWSSCSRAHGVEI